MRRFIPWWVMRWLDDRHPEWCWAHLVTWRLGYDTTWDEIRSVPCASNIHPLCAAGWCGKHAFVKNGDHVCVYARCREVQELPGTVEQGESGGHDGI